MERLKIDQVSLESSDNELMEKMKQYYLSSPTSVKYINDLGISEQEVEDNISKIYDFAFDVEYCKKCPGVKKCAKANPLLCIKIIYDHGVVDRQLVPCKELLKQVAFERQFVVKDFNDDWLDATLRNIDRNKGRDEALLKYRDFIKNNQNSWIYLIGNKNSGRSYFAAVLTIDAARKEKGPICFLDSTSRLRELGDLSKDRKKEEFDKKLALYSNVPILVLDDSVSAVDTETEEHILKSLHEIRKNKTTIVIAHRISTVKDLDFIIIIEDGKIIAKGSHQELLQTSKTYQDMVLLQQLDEEKEVK